MTILVTSLAMNYVHRGSYFPEKEPPTAPKEALPAPPEHPEQPDDDETKPTPP